MAEKKPASRRPSAGKARKGATSDTQGSTVNQTDEVPVVDASVERPELVPAGPSEPEQPGATTRDADGTTADVDRDDTAGEPPAETDVRVSIDDLVAVDGSAVGAGTANGTGEAADLADALVVEPVSEELKAIIEALVFASPEPLSAKALCKLLEHEPAEDVLRGIDAVRHDYQAARGIQLVEIAGGLQIVTRPDLNEWVRRLFHERKTSRLSVQALETLAVIAYRQPVTAAEIAEIRGVNTSGVLSTLVERKLVKTAGRKAVVGRPFLYATTKEFLLRFGLNDISDLPRVEDLADALGFELPGLLNDALPTEQMLPLGEPDEASQLTDAPGVPNGDPASWSPDELTPTELSDAPDTVGPADELTPPELSDVPDTVCPADELTPTELSDVRDAERLADERTPSESSAVPGVARPADEV